MHGTSENAPGREPYVAAAPGVQRRKHEAEQSKRSRRQILIRNIQCGSRNRQRQQGCDQRHCREAALLFLKTLGGPVPARQQSQKRRREIPKENRGIEWKRKQTNGGGHELGEQGQACMMEEKLIAGGR